MSAKDFQLVSKLGDGSYSSVWKVIRLSDGKEYAMKKVKMNALNDKEKENALNEVRILASIQSPYIIGYKEAFFDDNSMTLCIVMEFAANGDLYNRIQQHIKNRTFFPEKEIWRCFIQILKALKMLHSKKILHRDLKCANVFLDKDGVAKLGDLNVSKVAKNNLVYTQTGTPYYASPEVWRDQPYDAKSDVWSLGCVIYEMVALKPPFRAPDMQQLYKKVQKGVFDPIPSHYSFELSSVIALCLQISPTQRPSSAELLKNPIVSKHSKELKELDAYATSEPGNAELLSTIKIPKNMRALAQQLPKSNYDQLNTVTEEKVVTYESKQMRPFSNYDHQRLLIHELESKSTPNNKPIVRGQSADVKHRQMLAGRNISDAPGYGGSKPQQVTKESNAIKRPESNYNNVRESESEYLLRMQKEYLARAKAYSPNIFSTNVTNNVTNVQSPKQSSIPVRSPIYSSNISSPKPLNSPQDKHHEVSKKESSANLYSPKAQLRPASSKPDGYSSQKQPNPSSRPVSNYLHNRISHAESPRLDVKVTNTTNKVEYPSKVQTPVTQKQASIGQKVGGSNSGLQNYGNVYGLKQNSIIHSNAIKKESPVLTSPGKPSYSYARNSDNYYSSPLAKEKPSLYQANYLKQQPRVGYK